MTSAAETMTGRSDSAAELFELHADSVFTLAARILSDLHEAEDVVQNTFLSVQTSLATYRGDGTLEAWIHRIAYNESIGVFRNRRFELADPTVFLNVQDTRIRTPEQQAVNTDIREAMERTLASLSTTLRAAFVLRDIQLLSTGEVASVLDTSEGAVKMRLARARAAVRNSMRDYL